MIFELVAIFLALIIILNYVEKRPKGFPPGPMGFPVLGHLPLLGNEPHKTVVKWQETYGPIIGIWFGSFRSVVINDSKLIREAMNMSAFAGRPKLHFSIERCGGMLRGIAFSEGHRWSEQRRFAIRNLRDLGLGTKSMAENVQDEVTELIERFKASAGKPMQVKNAFNNAVVSALSSIMFGERLCYDDPDVQEAFKKLASLVDETSMVASISMFIPWLSKMAPKLSGFQTLTKSITPIREFLRKYLNKHNEKYVPDQPRDFVDIYMDEVRKTKDTQSSFHESREEILDAVFDLFSAGSETTSTTLCWLMLFMIHYPWMQKKLQEEIERVVGQRLPLLTDRSSMPYTEAFINETMRMSSMFPFSLFHATTEDIEFHGFFIPKDTMILPNLYNASNNKDLWGDPENFRPERFIDENGKYKKSENFMAFSCGKRACLGEGLARDELFLFTTNIFQTFNVSPVGKELPTLKPHNGLTMGPYPFEVLLTIR